jgi:hypothetical protein
LPTRWSQYGQGAASPGAPNASSATGSFWLDPIPDQPYALIADCACYPINLVSDSDVEAIPYQWTDAVPFFAAYYALMSSQTGARQADADRMMKQYEMFKTRARQQANPSLGRGMYEQTGDVIQAAKVGIKPPGGAAQ